MTDITPLLETVGGLTEETRSKFDTLARRLGDRPSDATERDDPAETDPHAVLATLIRINHDLFERMDRLAAEVVGPEAVLRKIVQDPFENLRFYTGIQFWLSSGDHLTVRERKETLMIRRHDKYDSRILFSLTHMEGPDTFNFIEEDALRETADFVRPHRPRDFRRDHRHKACNAPCRTSSRAPPAGSWRASIDTCTRRTTMTSPVMTAWCCTGARSTVAMNGAIVHDDDPCSEEYPYIFAWANLFHFFVSACCVQCRVYAALALHARRCSSTSARDQPCAIASPSLCSLMAVRSIALNSQHTRTVFSLVYAPRGSSLSMDARQSTGPNLMRSPE